MADVLTSPLLHVRVDSINGTAVVRLTRTDLPLTLEGLAALEPLLAAAVPREGRPNQRLLLDTRAAPLLANDRHSVFSPRRPRARSSRSFRYAASRTHDRLDENPFAPTAKIVRGWPRQSSSTHFPIPPTLPPCSRAGSTKFVNLLSHFLRAAPLLAP